MKFPYLLFLLPLISLALPIGSAPLHVTLSNEHGGTLNSMAWDSSTLQGKITILFYVDPDEKETNTPLSEALKAEQFDAKQFGSVAIINMAATWLPNFALESALESKQTKYPRTLYVKDMDKYLVQQWQLEDDASNVLLFDKTGALLFQQSGQLDSKAIADVIRLIKEHL